MSRPSTLERLDLWPKLSPAASLWGSVMSSILQALIRRYRKWRKKTKYSRSHQQLLELLCYLINKERKLNSIKTKALAHLQVSLEEWFHIESDANIGQEDWYHAHICSLNVKPQPETSGGCKFIFTEETSKCYQRSHLTRHNKASVRACPWTMNRSRNYRIFILCNIFLYSWLRYIWQLQKQPLK